MPTIFRLIIAVTILLCLYFIYVYLLKMLLRLNVMKSNIIYANRTIILPPIFFGLLIIFIVVLLIFFPSSVSRKEFLLFFILPIIYCSYLTLKYFNWQIMFDKDKFEYTNIYGRKFIYAYSEIISITTHYDLEIIKVANKIIRNDTNSIGKSLFLEKVDENRIFRKYKLRRK